MKKSCIKITSLVMSAVFMFSTIQVVRSAPNEVYKEFYVSVSGDDSAEGTKDNPFKTIKRAKEEVAKHNKQMQGDIIVNITGGVYYQTESIDFLDEDSGYNGYDVIYKGIDMPMVSGGVKITGFTKSEVGNDIYEIYLPDFNEGGITKLYNANGGRRQIAKSEGWLTPLGDYDDVSTEEYGYDGLIFNPGDIPELYDCKNSELVWYRGWTLHKFHPESVEYNPTRTIVRLANPTWSYILQNKGVVSIDQKVTCYLQNDLSLLDSPGEFYYDKNTSKLYYMPLAFEDMETEEFIVPSLETFAFFMGSKTAQNESDSQKVRNITFEGIKFAHFDCDKSYEYVYSSGQGPSYGGRSRQTYSNDNGAFYLNRADNINFYGNEFCEMVQTPINFRNDVSNCKVEGNNFYDLSASAIDIGETAHIVRKGYGNVNYTINRLPKTDYNMMLLNPYISASELRDETGGSSLAALTIMPNNTNSQFYPDRSFMHTSVQDFSNYKEYTNPATWKSSKGNAWIMYDFSREYTFSEIALAFDPDEIKDEEKNGFEVLLSNDKNFSEGSYVKVAESDNTYGETVDFKLTDKNKYRYLMIRAKNGGNFAVTGVFAFTPDIPHQIVRRGCNNISIKNNNIENACCDEFSQCGIFVYHCDNLSIENNEISNLPYTGISYGLNWGSYGLCGKGSIKNNYIHDVCQILYDGGAIYTLGNHEGSVVSGNYVENAVGGVGYYFDNGTYGINAENNVEQFSRATITFNSGSDNCTVRNIYTTSENIEMGGGANIAVDEAIIYNTANEPETVKNIKNGAGLINSAIRTERDGSYSVPSYDLVMGLSSNCEIAQYRAPKYYNAVKNSLVNASADETVLKPVRDKLSDICNKYSEATPENSAMLLGYAKNIDNFVNAAGKGAVLYVSGPQITDFEINDNDKEILIFTDSEESFTAEFTLAEGVEGSTTQVFESGKKYEKIFTFSDGTNQNWTISVKDAVNINVESSDKISNIGKNPLLTISFNYMQGVDALNAGNVTVKRAEDGAVIRTKPYKLTENLYKIDNSVFSAYSNLSGDLSLEKAADYDVLIDVDNVVLNTREKVNKTFKRTVDKNTLPVPYTEGKILKNVARGKVPEGVYTAVVEHINLTDEQALTYDRYDYARRENQDQRGYCFRIDLGQWYDVAAVVTEAAERDYTWDNQNSCYGMSADKVNLLSDTDILLDFGEGIKNGKRVGVMFEKNEMPRYRYFLGGPNEKRDVTNGTLLIGDVYVYALVDENGNSEISRDFDISDLSINYSENKAWGEVKTSENVTLLLALYKNGRLINTVKSDENDKSVTSQIDIPTDWSEFPKNSDGYELKLFTLSSLNELKPYTEAKEKVVPQISCWGDSYTDRWPEKLQEMIGEKGEVHNLSFNVSTAADIAGKQGGVPIVLSENVTLTGGEKVKVSLKSSGGETNYKLNLYRALSNPDNGINPCSLGGIVGNLYYENDSFYFGDYGEENCEIESGAKLVTSAQSEHDNDIHIIMTGVNGGFGQSTNEWALLEEKMTVDSDGNNRKFIVMSMPSNIFAKNEQNTVNVYRERLFGDNFLNLYKELKTKETFERYGIELTDEDVANIGQGKIPVSITNKTGTYLNDKGIELVAKLVYEKLTELNYIEKE